MIYEHPMCRFVCGKFDTKIIFVLKYSHKVVDSKYFVIVLNVLSGAYGFLPQFPGIEANTCQRCYNLNVKYIRFDGLPDVVTSCDKSRVGLIDSLTI